MKYYPFGETRPGYPSGSVPTDRRYTGQREENGLGSLYDYNARMYSPVLGRFLSADTLVPDGTNPQSWNRYAYVVNNPLKYKDPSGHCFIFCIVIIGAAIGAMAGAGAYTAEVITTGSGWDANAYWGSVATGTGTDALTAASIVVEPVDYAATGIQCVTSGCSAGDIALTAVPRAWGTVGKQIDNVLDGVKAVRANILDALVICSLSFATN
jgi:RHS repeat-associated protein